MYCDYCDNVGNIVYTSEITGNVCYDCFAYGLEDLKVGMQVRVKPYYTSNLICNAKYTITDIRIIDEYTHDAWITFKGYNREYHYGTLSLKPVN